MKHDDKHYEKFAKTYKKCKGVMADVQDKYPNYSYSTLYRWVRTCKDKGFL
jgi:hypothetical protein